MLYPEKWVAAHLADFIWGIKGDAFPVRESDNGCTWFLTKGEEHYIMQVRPGRIDMGLWARASELCTLVPWMYLTHDGSPAFHDLHWTWTIQEWRNGISWPETWESAQSAGKALRTLHDALIGLRGPKRGDLYSPFDDGDIREIRYWAKDHRGNPWAKEVYAVAKMLPKMRTFYHKMEVVADKLPQQLVHADYHPGNVLFWRK
jgi:Ser/Thr protein kinase RdoA (MazF antagonist)